MSRRSRVLRLFYAVVLLVILTFFWFIEKKWQDVALNQADIMTIGFEESGDTKTTPSSQSQNRHTGDTDLHTDLLIIAIDNRFGHLKNVINADAHGLRQVEKFDIPLFERSQLGYNYYTLTINMMYCYQFNYTLLVLDFPLHASNSVNDPNTNKTVLDVWHTCQSRYNTLSPTRYVPLVWCKLDILTYYLQLEYLTLGSGGGGGDTSSNTNIKKLYYSWLLYLDSDAHFIPFDVGFDAWLQHINAKFNQSINFLQKSEINPADAASSAMQSVENEIQWIAVNDTPLFIKREKPRLQNAMQKIKEAQCDTYANAGIVFMRKSAKSLEMIQAWGDTINKVPGHMIERFPREQGSLNCFISVRYEKNFYILPSFDEINLDRFIKYNSYLQHITSGYPQYRMVRFPEFIRYLIYMQTKDHDARRKQESVKVKYLNDHGEMNINETIVSVVNQPYYFHSRTFGNVEFIEKAFLFHN